jgi:hypothetical protein
MVMSLSHLLKPSALPPEDGGGILLMKEKFSVKQIVRALKQPKIEMQLAKLS